MKFNFWQMLGLALLIIGGGLLIYREMNKGSTPATNPSAVTQPK